MSGEADKVETSVVVPVPPIAAFRHFTDGFGSWWPKSYTFSQGMLNRLRFEAKEGGRLVERDDHFREYDFGVVNEIEEGRRVVFEWWIDGYRSINDATASSVEVVFAPHADGSEVTLIHSAIQRHGGDWESYRDALASDQGWPYLLGLFAQNA